MGFMQTCILSKRGGMKVNRNKIGLIKASSVIIPMVWKVCPIYFSIFLFVSALHGLSHGVNTYVTALLYNEVQKAFHTNTYTKLMTCIILLGVISIMVQILNGLNNYMFFVWKGKAKGALTSQIAQKASKMEPIVYENPEYLECINKAEEGIENTLNFVFTESSIVTMYLPYFLFMCAYLFSLRPILAFSLILIFIPVLLGQILKSKFYVKVEDISANIRRKMSYYEACVSSKEYIKETRHLGAVPFFMSKYETSLGNYIKENWKVTKKSGKLDFLTKLVTFISYAGVLLLLIDSVIHSYITVGEFASVFASISFMFSIMEEMIYGHIGTLAQNFSSVRNFILYLMLEEKKIRNEDEEIGACIKLDHVDFMYPSKDNKTINDINLEIKYGEKIAIVGCNGAGKSTLVKLLLELYHPTNGKVIFEKNIDKNKKIRTSAVFQNFIQYKMTLDENVRIGDFNEKRDIIKALEFAELDISNGCFPSGIDTLLSKEFGGVDLSGGQWQRIAIARGIYRLHDLIVFDEPTSAIDPLEENFFYEKLCKIPRDKTVIVVTHRLASAKIADKIIVMDHGKIVEFGSHKDLLSDTGLYYRLWNSQVDVQSMI